MNSSTSHLISMLYNSSTNKYMIMVRNLIDEIIKKNMIKLIKKKKKVFTKFRDQNNILPKKLSYATRGSMTS